MAFRPLTSSFPTADDLLAADLPRLGEVLLMHLKSYEGAPGNTVHQNGLISQGNFLGLQEARGRGWEPEYGARQGEITKALMEAWSWLEREGFLIRDPRQPAPWFSISREGEKLLARNARYERWEKLGLERVKSDLVHTGGIRDVGGPQEVRDLAWEWVRMKENQAMLPARKRAGAIGGALFIAESRIDELRKLSSPDFDFRKLIRLCEELNSDYENGNYCSTAMVTRGILDHVPPIFGKTSFAEVANNYGGGGRSFKATMQHLDNASRKVSDGILHEQIRKSETLPTPQQVWCGQQLDLLLAEIVRIMNEPRGS